MAHKMSMELSGLVLDQMALQPFNLARRWPIDRTTRQGRNCEEGSTSNNFGNVILTLRTHCGFWKKGPWLIIEGEQCLFMHLRIATGSVIIIVSTGRPTQSDRQKVKTFFLFPESIYTC